MPFAGEDNRYLLKRKGVFHIHFGQFIKLSVTTFPSKLSFLMCTQTHISGRDYSRSNGLQHLLVCTTMEDYFETLYQYTDVLLLAEVFANFRRVEFNARTPVPIHYISLN
ncbi:c2H2-type domain-containing protein [Nephila pilipes]|uniref:C2H2-type domain-containing protein n=1 Tax=Nephila pilipes TaxID=299642 RepID=A0A8X6UAK6_NEPPI|nr:c2H2-type domain-containing protein [Nephila pilipes]